MDVGIVPESFSPSASGRLIRSRAKNEPPEKSGGRTLLSATQVSRFQHVRLQLPKRRKIGNPGSRRDLGGSRSEPPLPEDTRGDYSMRLSGSPPFACRQLREVYYHAWCTARENFYAS